MLKRISELDSSNKFALELEEEEKEDPIQVEISEVSFTGGITINYSRDVETRQVLNDLPKEIIDIDFLSTEKGGGQAMSFEFTSSSSKQLTLSLQFTRPTEVSQGEG